MAKDLKLIEQCEDKAKSWMSPSFDEETRLAVKK